METCWKPRGIVASVISPQFHFGETPMCFPLGFQTWKQSTPRCQQKSMKWKLGEKPHNWSPRVSTLGNSQPDISTQIPCIGHFSETSQGVSTGLHTRKQSTLGFHFDTLYGNLMKTYLTAVFFHTLPRFCQIVNFKVIMITFKVAKMTIEI